jgi:hypothetical protein
MTNKRNTPLTLADVILPGLPLDYIEARYSAAPGNEIKDNKLFSDESSACLVANAFGPFFSSPGGPSPLSPRQLPPLPGLDSHGNVLSVELETEVRFPWSGGKHPWLDVLIETDTALIGIESKRYEPFRTKKEGRRLSKAYDRNVWGQRMLGYEAILAEIRNKSAAFDYLDAAQLVKHAFALRTAVQKAARTSKRARLYYLYAEPTSWPRGKPIPAGSHEKHRIEIEKFAKQVEGNEVSFHACSYCELLDNWQTTGDAELSAHARAVRTRFIV